MWFIAGIACLILLVALAVADLVVSALSSDERNQMGLER